MHLDATVGIAFHYRNKKKINLYEKSNNVILKSH